MYGFEDRKRHFALLSKRETSRLRQGLARVKTNVDPWRTLAREGTRWAECNRCRQGSGEIAVENEATRSVVGSSFGHTGGRPGSTTRCRGFPTHGAVRGPEDRDDSTTEGMGQPLVGRNSDMHGRGDGTRGYQLIGLLP